MTVRSLCELLFSGKNSQLAMISTVFQIRYTIRIFLVLEKPVFDCNISQNLDGMKVNLNMKQR